ncbi:MAG: TetR/AcrR family transcriptional regulator [Ruminococcus sp.]|nr:TetR/AcrR family transcriptional regulator [Ruminococcus sp.]
MRVIKAPDVRKAEILDAAEKLFHEKGYTKTTTEDILSMTGIARGTLYYHFKGKEEILLAMIDRKIEQREQTMRQIAEDKSISTVEKLFQVIQLLSQSGMLAEGLHEKGNAELHQESFQRSLLRYTPVLTEIVEQGIKSGEFSCAYPRESVEMLFCASQLHDPGVFTWTQEERQRKKEAFFWMLEITLGISQDAKKTLYHLAGLSEEATERND